MGVPAIVEIEREQVADAFHRAVNMTATEIREWLATPMSREVGWKGRDGELHESVGHASGRWIADILDTDPRALRDEDYAHMRKVVGYVRRHLAQEPENVVTSRWRYSLMNWGHDPLKGQAET